MRLSRLSIFAMLLTLAASCGDKGKGGSTGSNASFNGSGGNGGILKPTANFVGAASLFVVDPSQSSSAALIEQHNKTAKKVGAPQLKLEEFDFKYEYIEIASELETQGCFIFINDIYVPAPLAARKQVECTAFGTLQEIVIRRVVINGDTEIVRFCCLNLKI